MKPLYDSQIPTVLHALCMQHTTRTEIQHIAGVDPANCRTLEADDYRCWWLDHTTGGGWLNANNTGRGPKLLSARMEKLLDCPVCSPHIKPEIRERMELYIAVCNVLDV